MTEPSDGPNASPADGSAVAAATTVPDDVAHGVTHGTAAQGPPPPARRTSPAPWLAGLLVLVIVLVIVGVAASPFWAPGIAPLLPWSHAPDRGAGGRLAALSARIDALETHPAAVHDGSTAQTAARLDALNKRIDRLAAAGPAAAQTAAQVTALTTRVAHLENARPAVDPAAVARLEQEVARLGAANGGLARQLDTVTRQLQAQAGADRSATGLALAYLQLREAVDDGRPFAGAYAALTALAGNRPAIAAAAAPLAPLAQSGVPGRAVLAQRLASLARPIARAATTPEASPAAAGWSAQAMARLSSLVTIRRVGEPVPGSTDAAAAAARQALSRGDLGAAIAALDGLHGQPGKLAQPWLDAARRQLQAEKALAALQTLLVADLGAPAPVATPPGQPPGKPPGGAAPAAGSRS